MSTLSRDTRRQLLTTLESMPILDTGPGRDILLRDLPANLVHGIGRNSSKAVDLDHIVDACARWSAGAPGSSDDALQILIENAIDLVRGSRWESQLRQVLVVYQAQSADLVSVSPTPPPITTGGVPAALYNRLRNTLLDCGPFRSDEQLHNMFAHTLLSPWRNNLPSASTSTGRVDGLMSYLINRRRADTRANALVLFLQILRDQTDPGDSCYQDLDQLVTELEQALGGPSSSG